MSEKLLKGHRYVEEGEIMCVGDLWFDPDDQMWVDVIPRNIGQLFNENDFFMHIRKVEENDMPSIELSELCAMFATYFCQYCKDPKNKMSVDAFIKSNSKKRIAVCEKITDIMAEEMAKLSKDDKVD